MLRIKFVLFNFFVFLSTVVYAQQAKTLAAIRITEAPVVDGLLLENIWKTLPPADDFTLIWPATRSGMKIPEGYETTAYIAYDKKAIYVGAKLLHPNPSLIPKEFSERDNIWDVNAETFFVSINTYNDDLNFFSFQVTSAGTIGDSYSSGPIQGVDYNYDTVYDAKIKHVANGWTLEMIIPYSAIRFPKKDPQLWGINFGRKIEEFDETYVWSPVNENILEFHQSKGLLTGVSNVVPPVRLFFFPYMQSAVNLQQGASPTSSYTAGVDLKYGLSSSFTLDASLIPDFGQVTFDDKRLNLGPFEQQFSENRAFFTEGADMFRVADLGWFAGQFFYSRRIGQEVSFDEDTHLNANEELQRYDGKPELINLLKLSGITNKKLSIGVLNAVTDKTIATIQNTVNGLQREAIISPKTNYNIISLTQQFLNDYSSVSFINANLNRANGGHNANNYAFALDLFDQNRDFNVKLNAMSSNAPKYSKTKGFRGTFSFRELKGNFRYDFFWSGVDQFYNQNELGIYNLRDHQDFSANVSYQILEESKKLRSLYSYIYFTNQYTYHSFDRKKWSFRFGNNFTTKSLTSFSFDFTYESENRDYDEPRVYSRYVIKPSRFEVGAGIRTNKNKAFSFNLNFSNNSFFNQDFDEAKARQTLNFRALYRFSKRFSLKLGSFHNQTIDDIGFLKSDADEIYFGRRDIKSVENTISMLCFIDSKKWINFRLRNFWSNADYDQVLFSLLDNGRRAVADYAILEDDPNTNFNIWNLDVNFEWWFAPGSNMVLQYRNQLFDLNNASALDYYMSLKNLFETPIEHQLSLRINYLIDYNRMRKKR
jgi:hypothetical protein